jgi:HD-GYP domain-containing protein (c-di-GMP phosphodiesterase class II)
MQLTRWKRDADEDRKPSLAEILAGLSFALDLAQSAVPGHALRSCLMSMRLGRELGLSDAAQADLYYAALLKDTGCSSNAARMSQIIGGDDRALRAAVKLEDWTQLHWPKVSAMRLLWENVLPDAGVPRKLARMLTIAGTQHRTNEEMIGLRCERGATIVQKLGMTEQAAAAVRSLDEHWDGSGYPDRLRGNSISLLARILLVGQHLDVFAREKGVDTALLVLRERDGRWFDPEVVRAAESLHKRGLLWQECLPAGGDESLLEQRTRAAVLDIDPSAPEPLASAQVDQICETFSEVVDAKSRFKFRHSLGVAQAARLIGAHMQLRPERAQLLHRAALLHDLGKLRVPNSILDKPGKLNFAEWQIMREHAGLTRTILKRIPQYRELADIAGAHHEKLDGSGYPNHLKANELPLEARILAMADVYGALTEDRPYRPGFSREQALAIMQRDAPAKLDGNCLDALTAATEERKRPALDAETPPVPAALHALPAGVPAALLPAGHA